MKKIFNGVFGGLLLISLCVGGTYFYFQANWHKNRNGQLSAEIEKVKRDALSAQAECRGNKETFAKARAYLEYLDLLLCPAGTSQIYECKERGQWLTELKNQGYALNDQEIKGQLDALTPQNSDSIMKELVKICLRQAQYYLR